MQKTSHSAVVHRQETQSSTICRKGMTDPQVVSLLTDQGPSNNKRQSVNEPGHDMLCQVVRGGVN